MHSRCFWEFLRVMIYINKVAALRCKKKDLALNFICGYRRFYCSKQIYRNFWDSASITGIHLIKVARLYDYTRVFQPVCCGTLGYHKESPGILQQNDTKPCRIQPWKGYCVKLHVQRGERAHPVSPLGSLLLYAVICILPAKVKAVKSCLFLHHTKRRCLFAVAHGCH